MQGYLVTITSAAENLFVTQTIAKRYIADKDECKWQSAWTGGSDSALEGTFKWLTGPELGINFWTGGPAPGGSPVGGAYTNWRNGVPENATPPGKEDFVQFDPYLPPTSPQTPGGTWNDLPNDPLAGGGVSPSAVSGYVIEYSVPQSCSYTNLCLPANNQKINICKNGVGKLIDCDDAYYYACLGYTIGITCQSLCPTTPPPCTLKIELEGTNIKCRGDNDGAINLTVTGGTPPFTYKWSNGATTQDLRYLCPGTYCVKVKDSKNCVVEKCITITQPASQLCGSLVISPKYNCGELYTLYLGYGITSLKLTASASGGTPPYTYTWTPTTNLSGSSANVKYASPTKTTKYTVCIKDANGCQVTKYVTIQVIDVRCSNNKVLLCKKKKEVCIIPARSIVTFAMATL